MNHIKNIEIKNFKSIRHQTIDDCRRINVFIGYPNVGKSNILEALGMFSIDETTGDLSSYIRIEKLTTLFFNGEISKQSEVRINDKYRYVARFQNESISFIQQVEVGGTSFEKEDTQQIFLDDSHEVLVKKRFEYTESKNSIVSFKTSSVGKENELVKIRKYEFIKNVFYSNKGYSSLSYPNGDNIFNVISTNPIVKNAVVDLFKPYSLTLNYDSRLQEFTISKITDTGIFTVPYSMVADTLRRLIFFKAAILSNQASVLLFEEPEAHMFPPYIAKFTTDLINDGNNNQYFIATHSPFVLNDFFEDLDKEDLSIYVVGLRDGETIIRKLSNDEITEIYQYGIDLFFNLETYLHDVA